MSIHLHSEVSSTISYWTLSPNLKAHSAVLSSSSSARCCKTYLWHSGRWMHQCWAGSSARWCWARCLKDAAQRWVRPVDSGAGFQAGGGILGWGGGGTSRGEGWERHSLPDPILCVGLKSLSQRFPSLLQQNASADLRSPFVGCVALFGGRGKFLPPPRTSLEASWCS